MDSRDYAAESGVSRSPGESRSPACFCVLGRGGLGGSRSRQPYEGCFRSTCSTKRCWGISRGRAPVPASRAARPLFYAAPWGLLMGRSRVLVGPGGGIEGDPHPFPCMQGREEGSCHTFPRKGAFYGPGRT